MHDVLWLNFRIQLLFDPELWHIPLTSFLFVVILTALVFNLLFLFLEPLLRQFLCRAHRQTRVIRHQHNNFLTQLSSFGMHQDIINVILFNSDFILLAQVSQLLCCLLHKSVKSLLARRIIYILTRYHFQLLKLSVLAYLLDS